MRSFASDNYASIHPKILKSIELANADHSPAYGADKWTAELNLKVKDLFGPQAEAFPVFNGTGANVVALASLLKSYEAVLCTRDSHVHVDECGALERLVGNKLIDIESSDAKLSPPMLDPYTQNYGNEHQVQAKVLCLTQSTERGTLYSLEELKALADFSKTKGIKRFIDGARFANATAALGVAPSEITNSLGVEVISLGGTKNGLAYGELIVSFSSEASQQLKFLRKQYMQLSSKMRYISAQFCTYFEDNLWIRNALHANEMTKLLYEKVVQISEVKVSHQPQVNSLFVSLPVPLTQELQKDFPFYVWKEATNNEVTNEVRWMCSFDTTEKDIEAFVSKLKGLCR